MRESQSDETIWEIGMSAVPAFAFQPKFPIPNAGYRTVQRRSIFCLLSFVFSLPLCAGLAALMQTEHGGERIFFGQIFCLRTRVASSLSHQRMLLKFFFFIFSVCVLCMFELLSFRRRERERSGAYRERHIETLLLIAWPALWCVYLQACRQPATLW